jgi:hypothetical protein
MVGDTVENIGANEEGLRSVNLDRCHRSNSFAAGGIEDLLRELVGDGQFIDTASRRDVGGGISLALVCGCGMLFMTAWYSEPNGFLGEMGGIVALVVHQLDVEDIALRIL